MKRLLLILLFLAACNSNSHTPSPPPDVSSRETCTHPVTHLEIYSIGWAAYSDGDNVPIDGYWVYASPVDSLASAMAHMSDVGLNTGPACAEFLPSPGTWIVSAAEHDSRGSSALSNTLTFTLLKDGRCCLDD